MPDIVTSKNGKSIRLTDERWAHIVEEHNELAGRRYDVIEAVADPTRILAGNEGEHLAVHEVETGKWLVAVYREEANDGFVITAFLTRRIRALDKRRQLWP